MKNLTSFDWRDRGGNQRRLVTVRQHIFWCYSALSVSRRFMKVAKSEGDAWVEPRQRLTKMINVMTTKYLEGDLTMASLDRDEGLALDGAKVCMHCGDNAGRFHMDHLLPQSRSNGVFVECNQVRSCPSCNLGRGNKDLLVWHREKQTFPSLSILRRYLKIGFRVSERMKMLDLPEDEARKEGLPFVPSALPRRFPPVGDLVWDHAYPGRIG